MSFTPIIDPLISMDVTKTKTACAKFIGPLEAASGPALSSYQDQAGVWTIGFGTTEYIGKSGELVKVSRGIIWTEEQCYDAFANDLSRDIFNLFRLLSYKYTRLNQLCALTSLLYNIGYPGFRTSTVLRLHLDGDYFGAADAFLMWDKVHIDGELVVEKGLLNRRKKEQETYLSSTQN